VHPWMKAQVKVFDHPWFAISDARGNFTLELPAGEHRLAFWHPKLGERSEAVSVSPGTETAIEIVWRADK
jgi:hypothetical protein